MPGGDRTGPRGLGSRTGRGLGYCAGYDTPGFTKGPGMGFGRGRGWGIGYGRGFGFGRGRGWGYRWPTYGPAYPTYPLRYVPEITSESELSMLKEEKDYLESELNGISSAIKEISKKIEELESKE